MKKSVFVLVLILVIAFSSVALASDYTNTGGTEFTVKVNRFAIIEFAEPEQMELEGDVGEATIEIDGEILANIPLRIDISSKGFDNDDNVDFSRYFGYRLQVDDSSSSSVITKIFVPGSSQYIERIEQGKSTTKLRLRYARPWTGEKWYDITGDRVYTDTVTVTVSEVAS